MGTVKTGAQDPKYRLGTSEPRTPSTPQSLAQLRDSILDDHVRGLGLAKDHCDYDGDPWPCPPRLLATLLSVENVAAGLHQHCVDEPWRSTDAGKLVTMHMADAHLPRAQRLLEAIGASHD